MKIFLTLLLSFLFVACATNPNGETDFGSRSTASSRGEIKDGELAYHGACNPRVMSGPLEILIDTNKDTLTLVREGKPVHGFPIPAVTSGFAEMKNQSPSSIKRKHRTASKKTYRQAIVFDDKNVIHGTKYAEFYQRWSGAQKKVYKSKKTGSVYVSPRHMSKVFTCANRFGAANVKVTTVK